MSYPPEIHQDHNKKHMLEVIKQYPLATLISVENNSPLITHLPLLFQNDKLIGHIDKQNPHAQLLTQGKPVTVIFSGPDCYISPSLFTTPELPTWNYIKVHLEGRVNAIENPDAVKQSMVDMTHFLETPDYAYKLDYNNTAMDTFINYVMGFEIDIIKWEGKFKLSQNKSQHAQNIAEHQLVSKHKTSIEPFLDRLR